MDGTENKKKTRQTRLKKVTVEVEPSLWKAFQALGGGKRNGRTTTWHTREALRLYLKFELHKPETRLLIHVPEDI